MVEADHSQGIEYFSSNFLSRQAQNLENEGNILEDPLVEKKTKILKDNPHGSSEFVNLVVGDAEDIPSLDEDMAMGREEFPVDDLEKGSFAGAAGAGDKIKVSFFHMEGDIRQSPMWFLVLLPDME